MKVIDQPDPIDVDVGARIRIRRKTLGMSQTALAVAIGMTFQQIQKYETGFNRTATSTLVRIAAVLKTTVAALVGENEATATPPGLLSKVAQPGAVDLLDHYAAMAPERRKALLDLTVHLVGG